MKRRIKSLHVGLVLRYTVFFLVSIVGILLMLMAFMGYFFESMTSEMSEGPKNTIYFSGNYSDGSLVMENMPIGTLWVDFLT